MRCNPRRSHVRAGRAAVLPAAILAAAFVAAPAAAAPRWERARGDGVLALGLRGQLSVWYLDARDGGDRSWNGGLRYIPSLSVSIESGGRLLDLEALANLGAMDGDPAPDDEFDAELYRLKLRYATSRTETRVGLQKVNFGPARLLRSLMWFDRVDPRDPLALTDGVYGARFRYTSDANVGLWLWGLYGNDETKGLELFPSKKTEPEFGGRLQVPAGSGELAASVHTRVIDGSGMMLGEFREHRLALDGRWDVEAGVWFEAVLGRYDSDPLPFRWRQSGTVGIDYTVPVGNGLFVLAEHMAVSIAEEIGESDIDADYSACMLSYQAGILDAFTFIGYFSWETERFSSHFAWRRAWDRIELDVIFFDYRESDAGAALLARETPVSGTGGQVVLIYNH
ncbi:MAG: hypothetical protein JW876_10945 [Candidatus Krumholzibacteriota bacterium]|nr:hypothetical protein [Candidatus Krumholzibacteriota bacterium]